ncbi:hypothetical protein S245_011524 [Arachis hypogaea]
MDEAGKGAVGRESRRISSLISCCSCLYCCWFPWNVRFIGIWRKEKANPCGFKEAKSSIDDSSIAKAP